MHSPSQTRFGIFAVLMLLLLLALAVSAQAALAAQPAGASVGTTPAAGTQGRGGIDAGAMTLAAGSSASVGTQGRGGASLKVAAVTPLAGTQGRGGVAAVEPATLYGEPTVTENGFVSRGRGGFPAGPAGVDRTLAVSSASSSATLWVAIGVTAAVALIAGFFFWAADRRRRWQEQSSLASYCTYHPGDSLCGAS
jgi:hypothetical protein